MNRIRAAALAAILLLAGAGAPGGAPAAQSVNLRSYERYRAGDDWAPALMRAVKEARSVYVPRGRYPLRQTVYIGRDSVRIHGDGAASELVMLKPGAQIIEANRAAENRMVRGIVVESLGFAGQRSPWTFAFQSVNGQGIRFRGNTVRDIGAFRSVHIAPAPGRLASDVEVVGNVAQGGPPIAGMFGVLLENTRRATVADNTLRGYANGIQWWGGAGDPGQASYSTTRYATDLVIRGNRVYDSVAGIWGSNGRAIRVEANEVVRCQDVCLDAESSDEVRFTGNTARFAGTAVLAVFHGSSEIVFERNTVEQAGGFEERPEQPAGRVMFETRQTGDDPRNISVTLRENQFVYSGREGRGIVRNRPARRIELIGNSLTDTVIDLRSSPGSTIRVVDNRLVLTAGRGGERPVRVEGSGARAEVARNEVRSRP